LAADKPLLVFVVGPTGAGKSAAALALALRFGGEIVNCDSMQVYRGFDIGTDKPPAGDRARVPHHLLDVADPAAQFTAADFASLALEAVGGIRDRGALAFLTGGTGLYFKALEDGLFPGPGRDEALRQAYEEEARTVGPEALWEKLAALDPITAARTGKRDKVRIVRALEVQALTGVPISEHFARTRGRLDDFRLLKIGLDLSREDLVRRIEERIDRMFAAGLIAEVEGLLAQGVPVSAPPFRALGYKHVLRLLAGEIDRNEAAALTKTDTRHYAKRQLTWFRKMSGVQWVPAADLDAMAGLVASSIET
jgi:tRNA dimethylallyltransferase